MFVSEVMVEMVNKKKKKRSKVMTNKRQFLNWCCSGVKIMDAYIVIGTIFEFY
jgi:hypothetical protein